MQRYIKFANNIFPSNKEEYLYDNRDEITSNKRNFLLCHPVMQKNKNIELSFNRILWSMIFSHSGKIK